MLAALLATGERHANARQNGSCLVPAPEILAVAPPPRRLVEAVVEIAIDLAPLGRVGLTAEFLAMTAGDVERPRIHVGHGKPDDLGLDQGAPQVLVLALNRRHFVGLDVAQCRHLRLRHAAGVAFPHYRITLLLHDKLMDFAAKIRVQRYRHTAGLTNRLNQSVTNCKIGRITKTFATR